MFAYGSLLPSADARRTAPKAAWRGRALLPGHRLAPVEKEEDVGPPADWLSWQDTNNEWMGRAAARKA